MQIMPWQKSLQKLPHALLFTGIKGIGKKEFIKTFAQFLLCQNPNLESACGICRACHLFSIGHHPDYQSYGEEDNSLISIDEVREIIPFLAHSAHFAGRKIVSLFNIETMQTASANALLKTLEEPSPGVHFLLTCNRLQTVLPTIKSRCIMVPLPTPEQEQAFLIQPLEENCQEALFELFFGHSQRLIPEVLHSVITNDLPTVLQLLWVWIADYIRAYYGVPTVIRHFPAQVKTIEIKSLFLFYDKLIDAIAALAKTPGLNKQLLFENLHYEWHKHYDRG